MGERLYNEIVLTKANQGDKLALKVGELVLTLLGEGECVKIYDDESSIGVIVIQHGHDEGVDAWGCPRLEWLSDEEYENLIATRSSEVDLCE